MNTNANQLTLAVIRTLAQRHEGFRLALVAFAHAAAKHTLARTAALAAKYTEFDAALGHFVVLATYTAAWELERLTGAAFTAAADVLTEEFDAATGQVNYPEYVNFTADDLTTFLECSDDSTPANLLAAAHRPRNGFTAIASLKIQRQEVLRDNGVYTRREAGGYTVNHANGIFRSFQATRRLGGATDTSNNDGALQDFFEFEHKRTTVGLRAFQPSL